VGAIIRHDYAEDIKQHRFEMLVSLLRRGEVSFLEQNELNLLADYLEGKLKKPKGRPKDEYENEFAQALYDEYVSLRKYAQTPGEIAKTFENNVYEVGKPRHRQPPVNPMTHKEAIEALCSRNYTGIFMGVKNVERLVTLGKKVDAAYLEWLGQQEYPA